MLSDFFFFRNLPAVALECKHRLSGECLEKSYKLQDVRLHLEFQISAKEFRWRSRKIAKSWLLSISSCISSCSGSRMVVPEIRDLESSCLPSLSPFVSFFVFCVFEGRIVVLGAWEFPSSYLPSIFSSHLPSYNLAIGW